MMPCYRVPMYVHRIDALGRTSVVKRHGGIIDAASPEEAQDKATVIFGQMLDFASVGEPEYLHEYSDHKGLIVRKLTDELRPLVSPDRDPIMFLDESLRAMIGQIRNRKTQRKARVA